MTTLGQSCKRVLRNSPSIKIHNFLNKKTHVESRFIKASGGQPLDYHKGASSELCQFRVCNPIWNCSTTLSLLLMCFKFRQVCFRYTWTLANRGIKSFKTYTVIFRTNLQIAYCWPRALECKWLGPLHKKWSFLLRISPVNVTKSAVSYVFSHIYWRNP